MQCIVGDWISKLDDEDSEAFEQAAQNMSRVALHQAILWTHGRTFGLTALKDHLLTRCVCNREE